MKSSVFKNIFAPGKVPDRERAFTLTDLLVVVAAVALLAVMCLSAMAKTRPNTQAFQCMNNHKQLIMAWRMYADDNGDVLVAAVSGGGASYNGRPNWFQGQIGFNPINQGNYNTNIYPAASPLWAYVGRQPTVFHCPTDPVLINVSSPPAEFPAGQYPRVRSISMNQVFGSGDWLPSYKLYSTFASIVIPSKTFVFLDEHPNSINDGLFIFSDFPLAVVEYPASYHAGRAAGFSFADGHSEIHRWQGATISPPYPPGDTSQLPAGRKAPATQADIYDLTWLTQNSGLQH